MDECRIYSSIIVLADLHLVLYGTTSAQLERLIGERKRLFFLNTMRAILTPPFELKPNT